MDRKIPTTASGRSLNDRTRERWPLTLWGSMIVATVLHVLVFALWPRMEVATERGGADRVRPAPHTAAVLRVRPPLPEAPTGLSTPAVLAVAIPVILPLPEPLVDPPGADRQPAPELAPPRRRIVPVERGRGPAFLPALVPARLLNGGDVARRLRPEYERILSGWRNPDGRTVVELSIDRVGRIREHRIVVSSGDARLDRLAERALGLMRFSPELVYGEPRPSVIRVPVIFHVLLRP